MKIQKISGATMGTRYGVKFFSRTEFDHHKLETAINTAITNIDKQMSTWKNNSDLMMLNRTSVGEWMEIPFELWEVLSLSHELHKKSFGAFNVAVGHVVNAWGFGIGEGHFDPNAVQSLMGQEFKQSYEVDIDNGKYKAKRLDDVFLDLSGIAKGYGVDQISIILENFKILNYLISLDGEVRTKGCNLDNQPWQIGIEDPNYELRNINSTVELNDISVATSGDYRHWIDVGNKRLSHTVNPLTALPLDNKVASVTVFEKECAKADAWATALMVLGPDKGIKLAEQEDIKVIYFLRTKGGLSVKTTHHFAD